MPSFIWNRDLQEAIEEPYEYPAQEQFDREAQRILLEFSKKTSEYSMNFQLNDRSREKAIWMLHNDALDSLIDMLHSLKTKRHKIAGILLRDFYETLDLGAYFYSNTSKSQADLDRWYEDEIIPHRKYRAYIKKNKGEDAYIKAKDNYSSLSKFTHRTYKVLLYGYVLGRDDYISYDGYDESQILVLPDTISMYYAILADGIKFFSEEFTRRGLISAPEVNKIWTDSLEEVSVPRRYITPKQIYERNKENNENSN